jgi:hypothetical protein
VSNLLLARLLRPAVYGQFTSLFAIGMLLVGIADQGWNISISSKAIDPASAAVGKLICFAVEGPAVFAIVLLLMHGSFVQALITVALVGSVPVLTFADSLLLARGDLHRDLLLRLSLAGLALLVPPSAAALTHSATSALTGVTVVYAASAAVGLQMLVRRAPPAIGSEVTTHRREFAVAVGLQAPNNLVSNGLVALSAIVVVLSEAAAVRVMVLALGLVVASAPLGATQIAAGIANTAESSDNDMRRQVAISVTVASTVALLTALFGPMLARLFLGSGYVPSDSLFRSTVLSGGVVALAYAAIALNATPGARRRAAATAAAASVGAAAVLLVTAHVIGLQAIPIAVLTMSAATVGPLLPHRYYPVAVIPAALAVGAIILVL